MAKGSLAQFISPAELADIKAELEGLSKLEPGAKTVKDAIEELMPIIRGCRARGHSWKRIAQSFSRVHGFSAASLRRYAYELDPSLKEPIKGIVPKTGKSKGKDDGKSSQPKFVPPKAIPQTSKSKDSKTVKF